MKTASGDGKGLFLGCASAQPLFKRDGSMDSQEVQEDMTSDGQMRETKSMSRLSFSVDGQQATEFTRMHVMLFDLQWKPITRLAAEAEIVHV